MPAGHKRMRVALYVNRVDRHQANFHCRPPWRSITMQIGMYDLNK